LRQGADRAAIADRKDDLYETPREAVLALLRVERLPYCIWEPCAGRGAIWRVLAENGHAVACADLVAYPGADEGIETPRDFLMEYAKPPIISDRGGIGAIVTNPPFKIADDFIRHGLSFKLPVIVLLRLMFIEGAARSDLIDRHLVRVWAGIERLPQMHREGWEGPKQKAGTAPFAWFIFDPEPHAEDVGFTVRRMSWRDSA
jgi:hypothetical protein